MTLQPPQPLCQPAALVFGLLIAAIALSSTLVGGATRDGCAGHCLPHQAAAAARIQATDTGSGAGSGSWPVHDPCQPDIGCHGHAGLTVDLPLALAAGLVGLLVPRPSPSPLWSRLAVPRLYGLLLAGGLDHPPRLIG